MQELVSKVVHSESLARVIHTFWQAAGGALLAGLLAAHSSHDVKLALTAAFATGLAALKAVYLSRK